MNVASLCAASQITAQAMLSDSSARMERVAEGVYAIVHADATEDWPHSNVGVIIGDIDRFAGLAHELAA